MKDQSRQVLETKGSAWGDHRIRVGKQSRGVGAGDYIAIPKQLGLEALGGAVAQIATPQAK